MGRNDFAGEVGEGLGLCGGDGGGDGGCDTGGDGGCGSIAARRVFVVSISTGWDGCIRWFM